MDELDLEKEKRAIQDRIIADILKGVSLFDGMTAPIATGVIPKRYEVDWDKLKGIQFEQDRFEQDPFDVFPPVTIPTTAEEAEHQRRLEELRARQREAMIEREYQRQMDEKQAAMDREYKRIQAEQTAAEMAIAAAQAKVKRERELEEERRKENPNWGAW